MLTEREKRLVVEAAAEGRVTFSGGVYYGKGDKL